MLSICRYHHPVRAGKVPLIRLFAVRWRCDAVVVRGYFVAFWILRFAVRKKLKVRILDFHGSSWREKANRSIVRMLSKYMEVTSFRNATHILSVSRGCAEHVGDLVRDKVVILQNGVDHKAFQNVPKTGLFGMPAEFSKSGQLRVGVVAHFGNNLSWKQCAVPLVSRRPPCAGSCGAWPRFDSG